MSEEINKKKTIAERVDYIFNKILPKKFIVFWVCTLLVVFKLDIPGEYWEIVKYYMIGTSAISTTGLIVKNVGKTEG